MKKVCRACKEEKLIEEFYRHRISGALPDCKVCLRLRRRREYRMWLPGRITKTERRMRSTSGIVSFYSRYGVLLESKIYQKLVDRRKIIANGVQNAAYYQISPRIKPAVFTNN